MQWSELQNLDFENVGGWPMPVKVGAIVLLCVLILLAGWQFDTKDQRVVLKKVRDEEPQLKQTLEIKQKKAANLPMLKAQVEEIEQTFGEMLRRLPDRTEVAALLVDISQQGLGAGLEFELFKPGKEKPTGFYVELPIQIRVTGDYHEFGQFISGVSDLPRIVTQHDIKIRPEDDSLTMETTAKTYRYLDENEELAE